MLARREVAGESVTLGVETKEDEEMAVAADGGPGGDDS
jgi:NADH-quinone oxidoreductase subunit J